MITTKKELKYYLKCDKKALKIPDDRRRPRPFIDHIWQFEVLLRYSEFHWNCQGVDNLGGLIHKVLFNYYYFRMKMLGEKLGFSIGMNVFGPGLSIAHYGCIVVNENAKIGENCRIHEGVTIGSTNGSAEAATIGNNCFLGTGCKIIGKVTIADDVAVGAGAVVVKDILENKVTVVGVPARIVSHNGAGRNVVRATDVLKDTL